MSELGLVTPGGKVVWGKYAQVGAPFILPCTLLPPLLHAHPLPLRLRLERAHANAHCRCGPPNGPSPSSHRSPLFLQVTNNPENDGCINAVLLV